jgi:hypothetical protein
LQYYVEALLYTGDAFSHGIIKDLLGDVNWRELFESIKGV